MDSSSTIPDSGVTGTANPLVVTKDTNSCFALESVATHSVEPFFITVGLQSGLRANQTLHVFRPREVARYLPSAINE